MLADKIEAMRSKGFAITLEPKLDCIRIGLAGTCDMESLPHLGPFLDDLHQEVERAGARHVVMDCDDLYFMNSASIKCFVGWVGMINTLNPVQRYSVEFLVNTRLAWQQRSLAAIRRYAPEIVTLNSSSKSL